MSHSDQGDHWDFLAADLGASSLPEEKKEDQETKEEQPEAIQEEAAEVATEEATDEPSGEETETPAEAAPTASEKPRQRSRGQKGDRVVSGFGYRRGSVDWANLARELGVEAMEEAPAPIPATEPVEETPFAVDMTGSADVDEKVEEAEPKEPSPQPVASEFGAGLLDGPLPEAATEPDEEAEAKDTEEVPQEERKGRRRRRRRKPRKSEEEQGSETPTVASETKAVVEEDASPAQEETREEEEEESGRRRGRRRGGRKRVSREPSSSDSPKFGPSMVPHEAGGSDTDDFDLLLDDDESEEEGDEASGSRSRGQDKDKKPTKKVTHRGIPSWEEAVGHIVDANLDGRSKKPDSSGYRQRSGRRRGGDRSGNRGRS